MESLLGKKVSIYIAQRQPDGRLVNVSIQGEVVAQSGDDEKVGMVILEAEQRGNSGSARIHITL